MDVMNLAIAAQDVVAGGLSLAVIAVVMVAMVRFTMRGNSPSVWILASEFDDVEIDLLEVHRGM